MASLASSVRRAPLILARTAARSPAGAKSSHFRYEGRVGNGRVLGPGPREDLVERSRRPGEIECLDEQARVTDLAAAAAAHEATQLLFARPAAPGLLLLQRSKRSQLALGGDDLLDRVRAERADQLVLEVLDAHVEAECLHAGAGEAGSEAFALEPAPEFVLLARVAEPRQLHAEPPRAEPVQKRADRLRAAHRQDRDALGFEVTAVPLGEG